MNPIPPYNSDAEEAVIGSVLIDRTWFPHLRSLASKDFYIRSNQLIWETFERLADRDVVINLLTVQEDLKSRGLLHDIGGLPKLLALTSATPTSVHAEVYAEMVKKVAWRRRMMLIGDQIKALAVDERRPIDELYVEGMRAYDALHVEQRARVLPGAISVEAYDDIQFEIAKRRASGELIGLPIPPQWTRLVSALPRLYPGQLIVISGDSGSGKSSLLESLAEHAAQAAHRTVYLHTEMSTADVLHRRMARHTGIAFQALASGELTPAQRQKMLTADAGIAEWVGSLTYQWLPDVRFSHLAQEMRRAAEAGVQVFLIDHFQDIVPDVNEKNEILAREAVVTWLAAFAEKRRVYVIVASQQNADGKTKWSNKPVEKAVVWLSVKREKLKTEFEYVLDGVTYLCEPGEDSPVTEIDIKKARFGKKAKVKMIYHGPAFKWLDLSRVSRPYTGDKVISFNAAQDMAGEA